ncbi:MAG: PKD domain-containing protein [Candidatus Bathyarchaeota archaeon]|nr:MAG: PKD domain-containing protein [Candidatus Bathyarchaeota archaeon]
MDKKFVLIILIIFGISSISTLGFYVRPAKGIIWKEGHITADETWPRIPGEVYRVIGDIYVDANVTLTIEPGVEVEFADGFMLSVEGSLHAVGLAHHKILFTSSNPSPTPGSWESIRFSMGRSVTSHVEHATLEYANYGIRIEGPGEVILKHNLARNCNYGIIVDMSPLNGENLTIHNNTAMNNTAAGFAFYSRSTYASVFNLNIVGCSAMRNLGYGLYFYTRRDFYNISLHNVTASFNTNRGIKFENHYMGGHFYNISISESKVNFNTVGVDLNNHNQYMYNVSIKDNRIYSNSETNLYLYTNYQNPTHFNYIVNNVISNAQNGIYAYELLVICENNTIFQNSIGIRCRSTVDGSKARFNDIYSNTQYGVSVESGALINAEYNYWGHSAGPYHTSLNPEGEGNPVNGDGTNLDFIPFLTSPVGTTNERPVAALEVDKITPWFNETVTLDATDSTDDGRVDYYFFDFGDGTNSGWTTLPVVTHKYAEEGTYNATLVVMDDFGVTSLDGGLVFVTIEVVPEFPSLIILPLFMILTLIAALAFRKRRNQN